jgi:hypothetical protein
MYGDNIKLTANSEFIERLSEIILYQRVRSLHHQLLCLVDTARNVSLLFGSELDSDHCDALLPVEKKKKGSYIILMKSVFIDSLC